MSTFRTFFSPASNVIPHCLELLTALLLASPAARQTQKPLNSLNSTTLPFGAPISLGRDYHNCGQATTAMIEQVIRGEDVAKMHFILPPKLFYSASPGKATPVGGAGAAGSATQKGEQGCEVNC